MYSFILLNIARLFTKNQNQRTRLNYCMLCVLLQPCSYVFVDLFLFDDINNVPKHFPLALPTPTHSFPLNSFFLFLLHAFLGQDLTMWPTSTHEKHLPPLFPLSNLYTCPSSVNNPCLNFYNLIIYFKLIHLVNKEYI